MESYWRRCRGGDTPWSRDSLGDNENADAVARLAFDLDLGLRDLTQIFEAFLILRLKNQVTRDFAFGRFPRHLGRGLTGREVDRCGRNGRDAVRGTPASAAASDRE